MSTSTVICIIQWILLYSSIHFLSLKADKCVPQACGDLAFPYPFRMDQNPCGLPGFEIICEGKSISNPGIPYLQTISGALQIRNISYDHILVDSSKFYANICESRPIIFNISDGSPFRISEGNKFFTVGCNTYGEFEMTSDSETTYTGSCMSWCLPSNQSRSHRELACKKNGCCEIPVPGGYTKINITAEYYYVLNETYFLNETKCDYGVSAIVHEDIWDSISRSESRLQDYNYSMRLDWAILNDTCSSAKANTSYQCAQNTDCEDKDWGYVCKCKTGYDGDGYINGTGCTEIKICTSFGCFETSSIIAGVCGILIAALFVGGSFFWILKQRKSKRDKERNFQRNGGEHLQRLISSRGGVEGMKLFSLNEIEKATNKFSQNLILGAGGYGTVYKGTLTNGGVVAVKRSKDVDSQEIDQFINEVSILSQINHRNVVRLLGCCLETSVPLLVYEYISNGTLFDHLHDNNQEKQQIPWEQRLRIATETAEALSYLHSAASIPIIHRDVKSSNILLDNDYNPKVADFGVSRLLPMGQTHISTVVQGTMGYLDPEYFQTVQLTEKSDVYSFGVVLVELLTGLQPVSYERMKNHSNLAIFFLSTINAAGLREIIDPRLNVGEGKNMESMRRVAMLAKECLSVEGEKRPSMKEVVQELLWAAGGERPHAWLNNDVADNPEEMVGLIIDEERSDGIRPAYSIPQQASSSFSMEILRDDITSGR